MKTLVTFASILLLASLNASAAESVTKTNAWTETYAVTALAPRLEISNIWGNVRVRPGKAGEISVTIDERRSAPTQALFDLSLDALPLLIQADASGVVFQVGAPSDRWNHRDACAGCRVDYQFEVLVPPGTLVDVGTVTDGRIDIAGIAGKVSASNVNGPISVSDLSDCDVLESVNGEVDISFVGAPGTNCTIETINGDITLTMPDGAGLDVALDIYNGTMVSEFNVDSFVLPAQIEQRSDDGRYHYRVQQSAGLRVAGGGPVFAMSSLNGDIRIQKTQ